MPIPKANAIGRTLATDAAVGAALNVSCSPVDTTDPVPMYTNRAWKTAGRRSRFFEKRQSAEFQSSRYMKNADNQLTMPINSAKAAFVRLYFPMIQPLVTSRRSDVVVKKKNFMSGGWTFPNQTPPANFLSEQNACSSHFIPNSLYWCIIMNKHSSTWILFGMTDIYNG